MDGKAEQEKNAVLDERVEARRKESRGGRRSRVGTRTALRCVRFLRIPSHRTINNAQVVTCMR